MHVYAYDPSCTASQITSGEKYSYYLTGLTGLKSAILRAQISKKMFSLENKKMNL